MRRFLITLPLAALLLLAGAIAFGGPGEPAPMASHRRPVQERRLSATCRRRAALHGARRRAPGLPRLCAAGHAARQRGAAARLVGQQRQPACAGQGAGRGRLGRLCAGRARPWRLGHQGARSPTSASSTTTWRTSCATCSRRARPRWPAFRPAEASRCASPPASGSAIRPVPAAGALHQPGRAHLPRRQRRLGQRGRPAHRGAERAECGMACKPSARCR